MFIVKLYYHHLSYYYNIASNNEIEIKEWTIKVSHVSSLFHS